MVKKNVDCKKSLFSSKIHMEEYKTIMHACLTVSDAANSNRNSISVVRQRKRETAMVSYNILDAVTLVMSTVEP